MYALASKIRSLPVMSLQTGEIVAEVGRPVIDPANLEVLAYLCATSESKELLLLMAQDIRQMATDCLIVDSEDELTNAGEIVRIQSLLKRDFTPLEKPVVTELGRRLGRVEDYTINVETNRIQKLYIRQSVLRSWLGSSLIIDRSQIMDVTPRHLVVRDATAKAAFLPGESAPESNT